MDRNTNVEVKYDPASSEELVKVEHEPGVSEDVNNHEYDFAAESVKQEYFSDARLSEYEDVASFNENENECGDSNQEKELKPIVGVDVAPYWEEDDDDEDKLEEEASLREGQGKVVEQHEEEYAVKVMCDEKYPEWFQCKSTIKRKDAVTKANDQNEQHPSIIGGSFLECGICCEKFILVADLKNHVRDHKCETVSKSSPHQ